MLLDRFALSGVAEPASPSAPALVLFLVRGDLVASAWRCWSCTSSAPGIVSGMELAVELGVELVVVELAMGLGMELVLEGLGVVIGAFV